MIYVLLGFLLWSGSAVASIYDTPGYNEAVSQRINDNNRQIEEDNYRSVIGASERANTPSESVQDVEPAYVPYDVYVGGAPGNPVGSQRLGGE